LFSGGRAAPYQRAVCLAEPIEAGHLGGGGGLIDEDKLLRIKGWLFFPQGLTSRGDVGPILFGCVYALFFKGQFDVVQKPGDLILDKVFDGFLPIF
jgi:hypothetical protein